MNFVLPSRRLGKSFKGLGANLDLTFLKKSYFDFLQELAKKTCTERSCACTCMCVCLLLCNFITFVASYNYYHNQDTELFFHHRIPSCHTFPVSPGHH